MKKAIITITATVGYMILNRLMRGEWIISGDLIICISAILMYLGIDKSLESDRRDRRLYEDAETCVKVADSTRVVERVC